MIGDLFQGAFKNRRILVTGHTGFKGCWLTIWLHHLGAEVIGYSLEPPSHPSLYEISGIGEEITSIKSDIREIKKLKEVFKTYAPEIVFHLAAQSLVRPSYKDPILTYETNILGTANILESCRICPSVRAIVVATSDKCYENKGKNVKYVESDPLGGYDPYSSSKGCAELVTAAYAKSFFNSYKDNTNNKFLASVRAGNVIGGGDWAQDRLVPDCVKALSKNEIILIRYPDAVRPWQHVLDALYGYLLLAQHLFQYGYEYSGAWNFGPNEQNVKPVKYIVEQITRIWGENASWKHESAEQPHEESFLNLDCSKAKAKLGWNPQWNLELALENTIYWYKQFYKNHGSISVVFDQIKDYSNLIKSQEV